VQSRVIEWFLTRRRHARDERGGSGWQTGWQHWPVYLTIRPGRPHAAVGAEPSGTRSLGAERSDRRLKAPVRGLASGSRDPVRFPIPNGSRTRRSSGRAPQFALVTGKRLDPDEVLASGSVVLGGDADHGRSDHPDDPRPTRSSGTIEPSAGARASHRTEPILVRVIDPSADRRPCIPRRSRERMSSATRAPSPARASPRRDRTPSCTGTDVPSHTNPIVPAASSPPTSMKVRPEDVLAAGTSSASRRKKISIRAP
jgi:hypothetical protein